MSVLVSIHRTFTYHICSYVAHCSRSEEVSTRGLERTNLSLKECM